MLEPLPEALEDSVRIFMEMILNEDLEARSKELLNFHKHHHNLQQTASESTDSDEVIYEDPEDVHAMPPPSLQDALNRLSRSNANKKRANKKRSTYAKSQYRPVEPPQASRDPQHNQNEKYTENSNNGADDRKENVAGPKQTRADDVLQQRHNRKLFDHMEHLSQKNEPVSPPYPPKPPKSPAPPFPPNKKLNVGDYYEYEAGDPYGERMFFEERTLENVQLAWCDPSFATASQNFVLPTTWEAPKLEIFFQGWVCRYIAQELVEEYEVKKWVSK
ncbi:hypothetical protein CYMTET_27887 [Cymbomonas tetramitiformis]|uniref:Uncharacterized protein n=1 Tax=Cymbomonas tetramitiformis TaxID=36881 RepID=A0AAE0KWQ4_9CHLO|nr:hypothetical protein CYMTET_27887 [Cymbomonas tetramitiformis]